jgi:hypothetical protein
MPKPYILFTPSDKGLWKLAQALAGQSDSKPIGFEGLTRKLCEMERGEAEVNIAQMSEIVSALQRLVATDPRAVIEVLAAKIGD